MFEYERVSSEEIDEATGEDIAEDSIVLNESDDGDGDE
jgi:hypothetical protein